MNGRYDCVSCCLEGFNAFLLFRRLHNTYTTMTITITTMTPMMIPIMSPAFALSGVLSDEEPEELEP